MGCACEQMGCFGYDCKGQDQATCFSYNGCPNEDRYDQSASPPLGGHKGSIQVPIIRMMIEPSLVFMFEQILPVLYRSRPFLGLCS